MEDQRINAFIRKHSAAGHSEAAIRRYFLAKGASKQRVDDIFAQYRRTEKAKSKSKRPPRKRRLRKSSAKRWITLAIIVLLLAAAGGVAYKHFAPKAKTAAPLPTTELSNAQKLQGDIAIISSAVSQYAGANLALPTSISASPGRGLQLCGAICDSSTSDIFTLNSYDPSQVRFEPYSPNLTVSSAAAIYLVPAAKCGGPNTIGGPNTKPRSIVLLYATAAGTELSQHCLTL